MRIFLGIVAYCPKMSSKSWIKFWLRETNTLVQVGEGIGRLLEWGRTLAC
ncbi:protein of unknown function [Limnospira indica PCC 8005]|uniref:Uncharacterized protein n=1 Tax=Limnospira indica PCC 8005 TaxID=376219 RepID=A0A9P1KG83_9CYAN|nr:protein of unknown function [Limnospira indica PCC 8005]